MRLSSTLFNCVLKNSVAPELFQAPQYNGDIEITGGNTATKM